MSLVSTPIDFARRRSFGARALSLAVGLFVGLFLALSASFSPANAANPAEAFIQNNVQKGLTILSDKSMSADQRATNFRAFLESLTSIRRIAVYTLGPVKNSAPAADVEAFINTFRDYTVAVYESRLSQYSGQTLTVTGSTQRSPNDYVVNTRVDDPAKKTKGDPVEVDFRVVQDNGKWVVIDVSVVGVWLAIEERDQFTAFLAQHGNDVKQLITHLKTLTAALKKG